MSWFRLKALALTLWATYHIGAAITPCGRPCREDKEANFPREWLTTHLGPADITSVEELGKLGKYVAPILYGGLGNTLFQLAAVHAHALDENVPCVTGFFKHWNRAYHTFNPWGGHTPPAVGATLKSAFPALTWLNFEMRIPPLRVFNRNAFKTVFPDEHHQLPGAMMMPAYIHGYFFHHKFWHHRRTELLHLLAFHPALFDYVTLVYGDWLDSRSRRASVSLHLRYGYSGEPAQDLLADRRFPPMQFYDRVFAEEFDSTKVRFLVFSDNNDKADNFMQQIQARYPSVKYQIIDENIFGWLDIAAGNLISMIPYKPGLPQTAGAYLDEQQPSGGKTILHSSFFLDHGRGMIPAEYEKHWTVVSDE